MISESDENQRASDRAHLAWAFALSVLLNLLSWAIATRYYGLEAALSKMAQQQPPELVTSTSIVHVERRPIPEARSKPDQQAQVPTLPKPVAEPAPAAQKALPKPEAEPTEIAREVPKAPPQPQSAKTHQSAATLAEQLAQQNAAFERETQQLNANREPLSNATIDPNNSPRSQVTYHMDISQMRTATGPGFGYLTPLKRWTDQGYNCYYGHYDWQYPDGGTESANIPWSFCYTPHDDPIRRGLRQFPFPFPLPGYRLPPGTDLEPVEKHVYEFWLAQQP